MAQIGRNLSAIRRQFGHYLLVQPNVHSCGIISVAEVAEFLGKLLARARATAAFPSWQRQPRQESERYRRSASVLKPDCRRYPDSQEQQEVVAPGEAASALVPKIAPTILPKMLIRTSLDVSAPSVARSVVEILTER
jgi:hypothetical protein